jgi:uncharacterized protein YbaP (TraB family)
MKFSFFRRFPVIILISFFVSNVFSQQKSNYTLLWKISGKGMGKPSYLFGTMHVKDRRVFNFSDSVMLCLQSCSRFALEVHPDTVMSKMFELLQNKDSVRSIDKLLNKDQYEKLAKKFEKKNGYSMGKTDPILLESLMEPDDNKPDDQVSFIDAYLYGIARTLNKSIYGLEDATSQFDQYYGSGDAIKERLLDLLDDNTEAGIDEGKEEMIKIYSKGNLNAIYEWAKESGMLDSVIMARNKVMANSMIKYMAGGPLFTAVGAAHLPGPDGVIALLKKAGYNVNPVGATFTGVAATYHIDYLKMNWPLYRDENLGYAIDFPGKPIKNSLNGTDNIIYPDMANDIYYGLYAIPKGTSDRPANRQDVINSTIKFINKNKRNKILNRKDFLFNKIPCTELLIRNNRGYMRVHLILANNLLYYFYAGSDHNHLTQPYANRYFNSFTLFPVPQKETRPWITYANADGAFSVKLPVQPQPINKDVPSKIQDEQVTFKLNLYLSTDTANSKTYLIRYNDYPPGTFLSDKNALYNTLIDEFKNKGKAISGPVTIQKDGFEGREIKVILTGGYYTTFRVFVRGSRMYLLLKEILQPGLKDDDVNDPFFDSFHFTPYIEPDYYAYKPDSANFKVQLVSKPLIKPDSAREYSSYLNNTVTCFSTNPKSGGLYDFEYSRISPYYRIENVDSLYKKMIREFTGYRDSLLKVDTIMVSGVQGREILTLRIGTADKRRLRILIDGINVFALTGNMDNSELFDKTSNTFFDSFKLLQPSPKADLASSKAEKICKDLESTDTLVHKRALGALSYYKFTTSELNYVYTALQRNYLDDTSQAGARYTLIKKLKTVNNDSTVSVLSALYLKLNGKDDVKASILNAIPFINKKTGYDIYLKLLTTDPPLKAKAAYEIFNPLRDSTEFAGIHFEQVLPFIKYREYRNYILRAAVSLVVLKNDTFAKKIRDNYPTLMAYAQTDIDKYLSLKDSSDNEYSGLVYNYMQLIGKTRFTGFNDKLTKRYLDKDPNGLYASDALIARINNHLPSRQSLVIKYLDSLGTRYDLLEAYNDQKQLAKVPLKYRTQDEFAKLCLYQSISTDDNNEDYGSPTKITLLGSILKNGSAYYVFKYLEPGREEKKELIGITGPYKVGSVKLNFKRYYAYTEYEVVKTNWRKQATKMIKPLREAYK